MAACRVRAATAALPGCVRQDTATALRRERRRAHPAPLRAAPGAARRRARRGHEPVVRQYPHRGYLAGGGVLSEEEHVSAIAPARPDPLLAIFGQAKPLIGMVHLRPLPGAPRYDGSGMEPILRAAVADAQAWECAGADGLIVENHGDIPFLKPEEVGPETVAAMTAAAIVVRQAVHLPVGINCPANAPLQAIPIRTPAGTALVRLQPR